ncbi:hypothetical protein BDR06DRAFT_266540 [Suillus hirtellus]|nr:hypothetical protein BDR06DRAFT_266540 [Suillus hirtellus]
MPRLVRAFQRRLAAAPLGHAQLMPYFEGYCGSPRLRVLSGAGPVRRHATHRRHHSGIGHQVPRQQHITNYIRVRHASLDFGEAAGREDMQNGHRELSATDEDILNKLAAGRGISRYEEIGLLEECESCGLRFASSALRAHIPTCVMLI